MSYSHLNLLPGRLNDAWNFACQSQLAKTDPTQAKPADVTTGSAAALAAIADLDRIAPA
jgi:hypothetical protein